MPPPFDSSLTTIGIDMDKRVKMFLTPFPFLWTSYTHISSYTILLFILHPSPPQNIHSHHTNSSKPQPINASHEHKPPLTFSSNDPVHQQLFHLLQATYNHYHTNIFVANSNRFNVLITFRYCIMLGWLF